MAASTAFLFLRYPVRAAYLEQVAQHLDAMVSNFQLRYPDAKEELDQLRAGSAARSER